MHLRSVCAPRGQQAGKSTGSERLRRELTERARHSLFRHGPKRGLFVPPRLRTGIRLTVERFCFCHFFSIPPAGYCRRHPKLTALPSSIRNCRARPPRDPAKGGPSRRRVGSGTLPRPFAARPDPSTHCKHHPNTYESTHTPSAPLRWPTCPLSTAPATCHSLPRGRSLPPAFGGRPGAGPPRAHHLHPQSAQALSPHARLQPPIARPALHRRPAGLALQELSERLPASCLAGQSIADRPQSRRCLEQRTLGMVRKSVQAPRQAIDRGLPPRSPRSI